LAEIFKYEITEKDFNFFDRRGFVKILNVKILGKK